MVGQGGSRTNYGTRSLSGGFFTSSIVREQGWTKLTIDADAAGPLWDRYFRRMVSLAAGRLPGRRADAEDVALSAFFQFCRAAADNRFAQLASRDDLWHLLVVLTARKAVDWRKYQDAQKRGGPTQGLPDEVPGRSPGRQAGAKYLPRRATVTRRG